MDKRKNGGKKGRGHSPRPAGRPSKPMVNLSQMQQLAAIDAIQIRQCLLCGETTRSRGVFIPDDPEFLRMGRPAIGRTRMVMYPLCERCHELADHPQQVEAEILAEMGRGAVAPPEPAFEWIRRRTD